jgi:hypothetical protein
MNLNEMIRALSRGLSIKPYGRETASIWAEARLRNRIDAVIVHEQLEGLGYSHQETLTRAAATPLAITASARRILRAMERKR